MATIITKHEDGDDTDSPASLQKGELAVNTQAGKMWVGTDTTPTQLISGGGELPEGTIEGHTLRWDDTTNEWEVNSSVLAINDTLKVGADTTTASARGTIDVDTFGASISLGGNIGTPTFLDSGVTIKFRKQNAAEDFSAGFSWEPTTDTLITRSGDEARTVIGSDGSFQINQLSGTGNRALYADPNGILTESASDASLKDVVSNKVQGLDEVMNITPVRFTWRDEDKMGAQVELGLLAQDVEKVVPEVIGARNDGKLTVDYPKLVAVLIKAVQELNAKVEKLS